jgi:hypothetical protein
VAWKLTNAAVWHAVLGNLTGDGMLDILFDATISPISICTTTTSAARRWYGRTFTSPLTVYGSAAVAASM